MIIKLTGFGGEIPRTIPRLLPDSMAQDAFNTKLENGALTPIRQSKLVSTLAAPAKTIFKNGESWLSWDAYVDVVRGPVADDRLYVTGDGKPKMIVGGATYPLAVPKPDYALYSTISGTPAPDLESTIIYTYTWVTQFGEESEPAPLSAELLWSPGLAVTLSGFESWPTDRAINKQRIYRSQTSSIGLTDLFFIAERPASMDVFVDNGLTIVEPIPSITYNSPPDNMNGLTSMPNGMMAAFAGKNLYFCTPYIPHSWPESYMLTTDYEIVGLGAFGSSLAVTTTGTPYVVSGATPESMVMEKLELNLPCINKQGMVDLGYSVAYPSHNGLVSISSNGAQVVTGSLLTRDEWLEMLPSSFLADQYSGRYMASYAYRDETGAPNRGVLIIDLSGEQPFLIRNTDYAHALFYQIETGQLYYVKNDVDIYEWDAIGAPPGEQFWRSKQFVIQTETSFGALLVEGESATATTSQAVSVYADRHLVFTTSKMNRPVRLPGGFLARTWEIEVRGNLEVTQITMATSPSEMAEG